MNETSEKFLRWFGDARIFVRECFGAVPDAWQLEALEAISIGNHDCLAMVACKGPGKSTVLAWITLWWMCTRKDAQVIATSVTKPNLRDGLWKEIGLWHQKSELMKAAFTYSAERLFANENPSLWFVSARGWSQDAGGQEQAETLAGFHAHKALYIGDEFGGCTMGLLGAAEAVRANAHTYTPGPTWLLDRWKGPEAKLVVAGNPTDPTGPLGKISRELRGKPWKVLNVTSDPDDPNRTPRVTREWAQEQIDKHPGGREHPFVMVNVLGQFPPTGFSQLISLNDVRTAMERRLSPEEYKWAQKRMGVDVGLQGDDPSCIIRRQGLAMWLDTSDIMKNATIPEIVTRIATKVADWPPEILAVDNTGGFGSGVVQGCRDAGFNVIGVQFAGRAHSDKFLNLRCEMIWKFCDWIRAGGMLPDNDELLRELTCVRYGTTKSGKFYVEAKDEIKKRLGHSTDILDAAASTFCLPDQPSSVRDGDPNPILAGAGPAKSDLSYNYRRQGRSKLGRR